MTDYKNIFGKPVKFLATDPDNAEAEGQIWYNSTSDTFKSIVALEAWSSGAPINFNRAYIAGFGTTTAAVGAGGYNSPATYETATEEYNGSGWATGGALNTARYGLRGAGSQTAGLVFMGIVPGSPSRTGATEEYDGSSWTNGGNLSEARYQGAAAGTQTTGLAIGGGPAVASPPVSTATEEYNGTAWTTGGALNTAIRDNASASAAPQTAAISFGGNNVSGFSAQSEEYDGSSWTVVNSMNLARAVLGGSGIQTSALGYGGAGAPSNSIAKTEFYDGTNWSTSPADLATGRRYLAGAGSNGSAAVAFQGKSGVTNTTLTEEYNKSANVITGAAWSSGGNLNTGNRNGAAGAGIQTASIIAGGGYSSPLNNSESYDGSSWTNSPTMGTARGYLAGANAGPSTATVIFGGLTASSPAIVMTGVTEEYNGTSWSEQNDLSTARRYHAGFGTQTAAVCAGGDTSPTPRTTAVEEYDGTNWTSGTALPAGAQSWGSCGTQTTGLAIGDIPMFGYTYDGSTWTSIPTLNVPGNYTKVFGTQAAAIQAGRNNPPNPSAPTTVEGWDGTSWFSQASLATGRFNGALTGTSTSGLVAGGGASTATEEFNGETTALNLKTLTTS